MPLLRVIASFFRAGSLYLSRMIKRFGDVKSPGLLSFPRPGYTLTLDFANQGRSTLELLSELDRITVGVGGAVNPYKDARMSAATFSASFPGWRKLQALKDPGFISDFWRRTAGAITDDGMQLATAAE